RVLRRWYRNRYRSEALLRLRQLGQGDAGEDWLCELNKLLKLTAMEAYSREHVAPLAGPAWVEFLNAQCPEPPFCQAHADLLGRDVYSGRTPAEAERRQLLDACAVWVECHSEAGHV
ncbi:MAG: DUF4381 domain-containing protein, partial [Halioglobus sp.]|nr:DUF4381 domain-containing protein [Halioglobus sp.]